MRGVVDEGILKELGQPTLNIQIDRERASLYNINVNDIQTVVANAIGGAAVTNLLKDEKTFDGRFNQMKQAQKKLMLIVPLALLGIFLLLVSAFGNFRDAFIVMINVPFAAIGGVIALHLAGETLSVSAFFGFFIAFWHCDSGRCDFDLLH